MPCRTKRKLTYSQVATYGLVAAGVNAVISTIIATYYADIVRTTNPNAYVVSSLQTVHIRITSSRCRAKSTTAARDVLEIVDAKINQELASRGLGQVPLDEVD